MTNKQTIDGVSRDLLERLLNAAEWQKIDFVRSESPFKVEIAGTVQELRALLDKPNTPYTPKGIWSFEYIDGGDIVIRNGEDWTLIKRGDGPIYEQFLYRFCEEQMKPAAQPQGEVERLRYKAELYDEVWELATGLGYMNVTTAIGTLRAQLAERDALLEDCLGPVKDAENNADCTANERLYQNIGNAISATLSTSVEPKPRGEAVAWRYHDETGISSWFDGSPDQTSLDFVGARGGRIELAFSKASENQATTHSGEANAMVVKVVLPERMHIPDVHCPERINAQGWNACIDKAEKLNGIKP